MIRLIAIVCLLALPLATQASDPFKVALAKAAAAKAFPVQTPPGCNCAPFCDCGPLCGCGLASGVSWHRPRTGESLWRKDVDGSWWAYNVAADVWRCWVPEVISPPVVHALPLASTQFAAPMGGGFGGGRACSS